MDFHNTETGLNVWQTGKHQYPTCKMKSICEM